MFANPRLGAALLAAVAAAAMAVGADRKAMAQFNGSNMASVEYLGDDSIFPNPERGFYGHYQPGGGGIPGQQDTPHPPLVASELRALRDEYEAVTLVRDCILVPRRFWTEPISAEFLDGLQRDFDAVREAGVKTAPRILYDWGMLNRDPDEAVIVSHIEQLRPLFVRNADVIAWVQAGFYGGTGEGCRSDHDYVYADPESDGWQRLSEAGRRIYTTWLEAIPQERMMTIRYPRLKWDMLGEDAETAEAVTAENAYDGSIAARIGYYSDGFMGDEQHYAMYRLPHEAEFTAADTQYVVQEGEISDATEWKLQDGRVIAEMAKYHQTALNRGGDGWRTVSAAWKRNGDYEDVVKRLGYRYRLVGATMPKTVRPGGAFELTMEMMNEGFGGIYNPRLVEVILRDRSAGAMYVVSVDRGRGNRLWLPGPGETKTLTVRAGIPPSMPNGEYEVILNLPDPAPSLYGGPEYSIRLANADVWEPGTGFNRLLHTIRIDPSGPGAEYSGDAFFATRGAGPAAPAECR